MNISRSKPKDSAQTRMEIVKDLTFFDKQIKESTHWNIDNGHELLMHKIHAYPAKFPAFLTPKIIQHLGNQGFPVESIADIFCGCGTSALESRLLSKHFYGFDINPVATLIAKTKSQTFKASSISQYYELILDASKSRRQIGLFRPQSERLNYWFHNETIDQLSKILMGIEKTCPPGKYRNFFLTAFSNILKPCSKWLTKSIKPQLDAYKIPQPPLTAFESQVELMLNAVRQAQHLLVAKTKVDIKTTNFLNLKCSEPFTDLIITSPPYVTSYEYADLHQLSTLWLGYVDDYKDLRKGTIGSVYNNLDSSGPIYDTGETICKKLDRVEPSKSKSVRKYFIDISKTVQQSRNILKVGGHAAFVIGNTSYKGVNINNAKYLTHCFMENGFKDITVTKRKISSKILTPYRDEFGQFSSDKNGRKVYSHEYLIIARKN